MDEDRTAQPGDARPAVVIDLDHEIVEAVVAAEPVAWFIGRAPEMAVIAPIRRVLAPGIVRGDPTRRQQCARPGQPVGSPPQPQRTKPAGRRAAIAFALCCPDSGAAERHRDRSAAGEEPALQAPARPSTDSDDAKRTPSHGVLAPLLSNRRLLLYCA